MGLPAGLSSCPKGQDNSGVAVEEPSGLHQRWEWGFLGRADLKTLDNKLWAVLKDVACWKRHNSLETLRRSLVKAAAEIPLEMEFLRRQQSGQSVSRLASRLRVAILSDIVINDNLKLLQINYLGWIVDVLYNFPSRSRTYNNLWQDLVKWLM